MFRIREDPSSGSLVQCLAKNYKNDSIVSVDMDNVGVMVAYSYTGNYKHTHNGSIGRTTCQPDLTTFPQPRHITTRGYNITQSSAPEDGHMVARNMLSNY
jgi:hypothetical protein